MRNAEWGVKTNESIRPLAFAHQYSVLSTQYLVLGIAVVVSICGVPVAVAQQPASSGTAEVVVVGKPVRKTLTLVSTQPARIEAIEQAPIYSKLAAYVGEVLVDYGDKVKKGQVLVKLLAPELDADLAQKKAQLETSRAQLVQAEAGAKAAAAVMATAASKIAQAEAGIGRARADVSRWQSEFSRLERLAGSGSVNRQIVDEAQQKLSAAEASLRETQAAVEAAKAAARQAEAEAAKAAADVTAAKARIRVSEADVEQAAAQQSYLTIQSPLDGVVTQRGIDPGHFVQPAGGGAAALVTIARTDRIRVFVAVPEVEAGYTDIGDRVTLDVASLRGAEIQGKVTRTAFAVDPGNRSLETIIDLDNANGRLRPGMFATAKIVLDEKKDALTLPSPAVVRQGSEAFCYRLIGGKSTKTPIQVGLKVGNDFEVTGGVAEGSEVILNKAVTLKDGQSVEATRIGK